MVCSEQIRIYIPQYGKTEVKNLVANTLNGFDLMDQLWMRSLVFSVQGCTAADQILSGNTGRDYWNHDRSIWGVQMTVILHVSATQAFQKISLVQERQMGFSQQIYTLLWGYLKKCNNLARYRVVAELRESQELFNSWQHRTPFQKAWPA